MNSPASPYQPNGSEFPALDGFRIPPQSLEAEQGTLGSALMSRPAALAVVDLLEELDFYIDAHQRVFRAVTELVNHNRPVDLLTVTEELRRTGDLERIGGMAYLAALNQAVPTAAHVEHYARLVKGKSELRTLIDFCGETVAQCFAADADPEEIRHMLTFCLLQQKGHALGDAVNFADVLEAEAARIELREEEPVLECGLPGLDRLTGGLGRGEVGIIAARPGGGKSALALMQLIHGAQTWGPMLYVSLEMNAQMVGRRQLAASTEYSFQELRRCARMLSTGEWARFTEHDTRNVRAAAARHAAAARNIWIDESSYTLSRLVHRVHRLRLQHGIESVVIDYGQLIQDDTAGRDVRKAEEVMRVARAIKNELAAALNLPVWLLAQVNREVEKGVKPGEQPRPLQMSDLGWSSELEAVAGRILFLNPQTGSGDILRPVVCDVVKNRNGQRGQVALLLDGPRFQFTESESRYPEPPPERRGDLWQEHDPDE